MPPWSKSRTKGGMGSPPGPETVIDGKRYLYFGGTGYFGLHSHPEVIRAGVTAFRKYGTHSATSRSGFGNNPVLIELESKLQEFFGQEEAVTFASGYLSSLVLAQALAGRYEAIFVDEAAHFCVRDAAGAMGGSVFTFKHRDPEDLCRVIKTKLKPAERPLLLSDGVFPTFGRIAPLPDYARIMERYDGLIGLDDAHGVGVLGPNGRGTYDYFGLHSSSCHLAGTLSKAFGRHGGFIVGQRELIRSVKSKTGTYVGSTPIPTPLAAATAKGIEILELHPEMRAKLHRNAALAKAGLKELGIPAEDTPVPIIAWSLSSEKKMVRIQQELMKRGIAIAYLKYAGAPAAGVLRVTIFSTHTPSQIKRLIKELAKIL